MISEMPSHAKILLDAEKKFHWVDFFYGDIIDFELKTILPALEAQFKGPENNLLLEVIQ